MSDPQCTRLGRIDGRLWAILGPRDVLEGGPGRPYLWGVLTTGL